MADRNSDAPQLGVPHGTAHSQLVQQVLPLKRELAGVDRDALCDACRPQLGLVERVAACDRLGMDGKQIRAYGNPWLRMSPESLKLRMVDVPTRFAAQNGPGQQCLTPQGDQALRIKIPGVK